MKQVLSLWVVGGLVAGSTAAPGFAADNNKAESKTDWKIAGELEEACSCRAPCPCWFKSLPSRMTCDGVQAVFIEKGRYGKTPLDGLALAVFVQTPEGKSMFESFGHWNYENVYIDDKASEEQREALKAIAEHVFPRGAQSREFHFAPMSRKIQGTEHSITMGEAGAFAGHLIEGGYAGSPKISNVPLADPTHREFKQGQTTRLTYKGSGQGWSYEGSNYMFTRFKVDGKEYEKFEADMAKKMAQLSPKSEQ